MNWVDFTILAIIAISVVISLTRGFTREALSLADWIIAFWIALSFSDKLEQLLIGHIDVPAARVAVAFAILFFITLLLAGLINYLAVQLIKKTGLSGTDRMIGIFFGAVRGGVVVSALVLLGGLTLMPSEPWWQQSSLLHYFQDMAIWLRGYLPPEVASEIRYG